MALAEWFEKRRKILYQSQGGETTVSDWLRCSEQAFGEFKGLLTCSRAPWQCCVNVLTPFLDTFHIWVYNFCNTPETAWLPALCTGTSSPHWKLGHFLRFFCPFPFCVLYHRWDYFHHHVLGSFYGYSSFVELLRKISEELCKSHQCKVIWSGVQCESHRFSKDTVNESYHDIFLCSYTRDNINIPKISLLHKWASVSCSYFHKTKVFENCHHEIKEA